ncbi:MAG: hypothetical protein ACRCVU_13745 [Flavobacterium sp.]
MTLEYLRSIQQDLTPRQVINSGPHDRCGAKKEGKEQDKTYSLHLPSGSSSYEFF